MARLIWSVWYWLMGCDDTLSANTIRWCRLNGKKYTDLKLKETL